MPKARGSIGFCTFKASRQQPDVVQPQFTTTTYFSSCVVRVYFSRSSLHHSRSASYRNFVAVDDLIRFLSSIISAVVLSIITVMPAIART